MNQRTLGGNYKAGIGGEPGDKASMLMSGLFVVFNVIIDLTIIVVLLYFR